MKKKIVEKLDKKIIETDSVTELLIKNGFNSSRYKLKLLVRENDTSVFAKLTEYIVKDLEAIGIDCVLMKVPTSEYLKLDNILKCDLAISGWFADSGDPDNFLEPLFHIKNVSNISRYNNILVNQKLDIAKNLINPEKRIKLYEEMEEIIVQDIPWLFLYNPKLAIATQPNILGLSLNSLGMFKYEDIIKN